MPYGAGAARARRARPAAEVDPRRTQRRARRYAFRARTRGGGRGAPRCGLFFKPGEDALRTARLSALFRSDLRLIHFSLDLLRSTPGWDEAFAHSISDLEGAALRPEDLEAAGTSEQLRDVAAIWRALDQSARRSWTIQRVYVEAAAALERRPEAWPFQGPVLAFAAGGLTAAEARFLRAIPQGTIGLLAARPARKRYLDRMEELLGAEAGAALRSVEAPRAAGSERDLLASYLFEPPAVLAGQERPRSQGPDGSVDLEEHAGVEDEVEATAGWVARQVADGAPLEEIAVLVPDLDPLAGLVAGVSAGCRGTTVSSRCVWLAGCRS